MVEPKVAERSDGEPSGVTAALGFRAAAVRCGIRRDRTDLALLVSDTEAAAGAVFTRNRVQAAPLRLCSAALERSGGRARAIVINSGNANACTGADGGEGGRSNRPGSRTPPRRRRSISCWFLRPG